jgi:hypothetical protein
MSTVDTPTPGSRIAADIADLFHEGRGQEFVIEQLLRNLHTAKLVKVVNVTVNGSYAGTVDVQRMVLDVDTNGIRIDETTTYALPFLRLQGGQSAIEIDPSVGDIGLAVFADRATQTAIATREQSLPDGNRIMSEMDGFYFGGFLNSVPTQFIQFLANAGGINITSPGAITFDAQEVVFNCPVVFNNTVSGTLAGAGNYSFPNLAVNGTEVEGHTHGGVQFGTSRTEGFGT